MFATHNFDSVALALRLLEEQRETGVRCSDVHFAQILGMGDSITFSLGAKSYSVHKLVPFSQDFVFWY